MCKRNQPEHRCPDVQTRWVYPQFNIVEVLQLLGSDVITKEDARVLLSVDNVIKQIQGE